LDIVVTHNRLLDIPVSHNRLSNIGVIHNRLSDVGVTHNRRSDIVVTHNRLAGDYMQQFPSSSQLSPYVWYESKGFGKLYKSQRPIRRLSRKASKLSSRTFQTKE